MRHDRAATPARGYSDGQGRDMVGVPVVFYRATRAHWLGREDGAAPELHSLSFVFLFFSFSLSSLRYFKPSLGL
jgi:hypothetical protein